MKVIKELAAEGWEVQVEPSSRSLPPALQDMHVDFIATRGSETLVGELASRSSAKAEKIDQVARRVSGIPGARFEVFWLGDSSDAEPRHQDIRAMIADARRVAVISPAAGLLTAWAAFEGAVADFAAGQVEIETWRSPRQLLSNLYSLGSIGQADFSRLNALYRLRSEIAHKATSEKPQDGDIDFILDVAERMLSGRYVSADNMVEWFLERYEDPVEQLPYDGAEGGYQYMGDGPYDAEDVLRNEFEEATSEEIADAVTTLEETSTVWIKKRGYSPPAD